MNDLVVEPTVLSDISVPPIIVKPQEETTETTWKANPHYAAIQRAIATSLTNPVLGRSRRYRRSSGSRKKMIGVTLE